MSDEDVRTELQRLATRRRLAAAEHRQASVELREAIRRAQDEGLSVVEIARLADLSRQGVYKLLEQES